MNSKNYVTKGFQHGAASSAGKFVGARCGFRMGRLPAGWVTNDKLFAEFDRGYRYFWNKRIEKGIYPDDPDCVFAGRPLRKVCT